MTKLSPLFLYAAFCFSLNAQLVPLGPAVSTFGVLAASTVTNTGLTTVIGNVGVSPGTAITGFTGFGAGGPGSITGTFHTADGFALQAQNELTATFNSAFTQPSNGLNPADIGGTTILPGVWTSPSTTLNITGTVTLDGQNNPNSIFIFQVGSGLNTATGSVVSLINQASAANVYWQVGSSAVIGTTSNISGNIMAQASITLNTGAILNGRALARTAAVTLQGNAITSPGGPGGPAPGPTPAPSSLILVATALLCAGLYQGRGWLLKPFRSN